MLSGRFTAQGPSPQEPPGQLPVFLTADCQVCPIVRKIRLDKGKVNRRKNFVMPKKTLTLVQVSNNYLLYGGHFRLRKLIAEMPVTLIPGEPAKGQTRLMSLPAFSSTSTENAADAAALPAREKLAEALKQILTYKDFNSITNAEISKVAGVNESLIYRYYTNKRGLLHHVLQDYMIDFQIRIQSDLKEIRGALNKLRRLIQAHMQMYDSNRVFARILLLEVRNFPGYFESDTYQLIRSYSRLLMDIIQEGIGHDEIRSDMAPEQIRDLVLGGIEHFCMAPVIFGQEISSESGAQRLCDMIFRGIEKRSTA